MTTRLMCKVGAVVLAAGLFGACSSDNPANGAAGGDQPSTEKTLASADPAVTTGDAGTTAPGPTPEADDLCTVIPDLAAIEGAIGVPVKNPLGIGDAGYQQSCTLQRATDDFPGITFTLVPGGTIAAAIAFAKTNFNIDIVPLDGAEGFYAGEGNSVYWEGDGSLYQSNATIDGDSRTASLNMLKLWLGM